MHKAGLSVVASICVLFMVTGTSAQNFGLAHPEFHRVWTLESGAENWIGQVVALGNGGETVFTAVGTMAASARLFSTRDQDPPTPLWQDPGPNFVYQHRVASAAHADVLAYLFFQNDDINGPNTPTFRKYRSASAQPVFEWNFPFTVNTPASGALVSDNGQTVIGWVYNTSLSRTAIAIFQGTAVQPTLYLSLNSFGEPKAAKLSADGTRLYISGAIKTFVISVPTGAIVHEHINWEGAGNAHAFSGDGTRFALNTYGVSAPPAVVVYEYQGGSGGQTYAPIASYPLPVRTLCNNIALSSDGELLFAAYDYTDDWLTVRIRAMNISTPGAPFLLDDVVVGQGQYSNLASDVAVSENGSTLVVGLWGDELGFAPEVRAYRRAGRTYALAGTFDLPGSVNEVAVSPDGTFFSVASKGIHANELGGDGRIDLFQIKQ